MKKSFLKTIKSVFEELKETKIKAPKINLRGVIKTKVSPAFLVLAILAVFILGFWGGSFFSDKAQEGTSNLISRIAGFLLNIEASKPVAHTAPSFEEYSPQTSQEEAVISAVKRTSPSVVSIIVSKDVPIYEQYVQTQPFGDLFQIQVPQMRQKGTEKQVVASGTGFIVSTGGMIITNKHVVSEDNAYYEIATFDGRKYPVEVLAKDPLQDLAILKIKKDNTQETELFTPVHFGNSDSVVVGQTTIAIGNALGEFSNSVSVGVISGLGRSITAEGGGISENLEDIFQTDAAINKGNSGGPLLNLKGEVIGVNVAMAEGAQGIGFAIPVNKAKRDIRQLQEQGKISYPFLGIRYILINPDIQEKNKLSVDYGALIVSGDTEQEVAIEKGSSAQKAGLKEDDIILEADGVKITKKTPLANIIQNQHMPGDQVVLKVLRDKKEMDITVILGEKSSD